MSSLKQPCNTPEEYLIVPLYPTEEFQRLYFECHSKIQLLDHDGVKQYFYNLLDLSEEKDFDEALLKITLKLLNACL